MGIFRPGISEISRISPVNKTIKARARLTRALWGIDFFVTNNKKENPQRINEMAVRGFIAARLGMGWCRKFILNCQPINASAAITITV